MTKKRGGSKIKTSRSKMRRKVETNKKRGKEEKRVEDEG
jgi:hypothetical protein